MIASWPTPQGSRAGLNASSIGPWMFLIPFGCFQTLNRWSLLKRIQCSWQNDLYLFKSSRTNTNPCDGPISPLDTWKRDDYIDQVIKIQVAKRKHHQAHDKVKKRYNYWLKVSCFTIIMLPTLMINFVSLTRTEAALENIIDTLVFPLSDK